MVELARKAYIGPLYIFLFALCGRIIFYFLAPINNGPLIYGSDGWEYIEVGKSILAGIGFFNPEGVGRVYFSEPIYPLLIAGCLYLFKIQKSVIIIQAGLSALTVCLVSQVLVWQKIKAPYATWILVIMVLHPYLNYWSSQYLAETIRVFALSLMVFGGYWYGRNKSNMAALVFGSICGFVALTRFPFFFIVPFCFLWVIYSEKRPFFRGATFVVAFGLCISPWLVRNYQQTGNFPYLFNLSAVERIQEGLKPETIYRITDTQRYEEFKGSFRVDSILRSENRIGFYLELMLLRLFEFFRPFPSADSGYSVWAKILAAIFNIPIFFLGVFGFFCLCWRKQWEHIYLLGIPVVILTAIHIISNAPHSRYSLPLVPIFLILAALGLKPVGDGAYVPK